MLTVEVFGNVVIVNGMYFSYLFFGHNIPLMDTLFRTITFLLLLPLFYYFIRPQYRQMIQLLKKGWWILDFVLFLSYLLVYYLAFIPESVSVRPEYFIHIYLALLLGFLIYATIFLLYVEIQQNVITAHDNQVLLIQEKEMEKEAVILSNIENALKIQRHDLRHQISIMEEAIALGDMHEAIQVVEDMRTHLLETKHPIYTQNKVINASFSYYFDKAIQAGIDIHYEIDIKETPLISPNEISITCANALENAIQACKTLKTHSKRIDLKIKYQTSYFVLEIKNPFESHIEFNQDGLPISLDQAHGIGVKSMNAFVKKYKGDITFKQDNDTFYVRILCQEPNN